MQGVKDKEVIAGELAAAEASLSATPRGAALMRKYAYLKPSHTPIGY